MEAVRCLLENTEYRWELSCLYEALSNLDEAEEFLLLCKSNMRKAKENSLGGFFGLWNPFQKKIHSQSRYHPEFTGWSNHNPPDA